MIVYINLCENFCVFIRQTDEKAFSKEGKNMAIGTNSYERYLGGDDTAFADIVREYADGLMLYINSFTRDIHVSEEVTEEVFFKLKFHFCLRLLLWARRTRELRWISLPRRRRSVLLRGRRQSRSRASRLS